MSTFNFQFSAAGVLVTEIGGKELPTLGDAHAYALRLIRQATCHFDDGFDWRGWSVRICSPENDLLLTVLFPSRAERPVDQRRLA